MGLWTCDHKSPWASIAFVTDMIYKVMDAFAFPGHDVYCKYVRRFENFVNYF